MWVPNEVDSLQVFSLLCDLKVRRGIEIFQFYQFQYIDRFFISKDHYFQVELHYKSFMKH